MILKELFKFSTLVNAPKYKFLRTHNPLVPCSTHGRPTNFSIEFKRVSYMLALFVFLPGARTRPAGICPSPPAMPPTVLFRARHCARSGESARHRAGQAWGQRRHPRQERQQLSPALQALAARLPWRGITLLAQLRRQALGARRLPDQVPGAIDAHRNQRDRQITLTTPK